MTPRVDDQGGQAYSGYNFAYLDEQTKRMIRRALLKAVAIPGYQVPFGGREMPMPYGWGTGGMQLTASILGVAVLGEQLSVLAVAGLAVLAVGLATLAWGSRAPRDPKPFAVEA